MKHLFYILIISAATCNDAWSQGGTQGESCVERRPSGGIGQCISATEPVLSRIPSKQEESLHLPSGLLTEWNRNSSECQDWLEAHRKACGEREYKIAKKLLSAVQFSTIKDLFQSVKDQLEAEVATLPPQEPVAIIVDEDASMGSKKSSSWIYSELIDKNKTAFQRLFNGRKVKVIKQKSEYSASEIQEFVRTEKGTPFKHFFRIDDAAYSGEQLHRFSLQMQMVIPSEKETHFHVITQFHTEAGKSKIRSSQQGNHFVHLRLGAQIPNIDSIFTQGEELADFKNMYPNTKTDRAGNLFLALKVPDSLSGTDDFLRSGLVKCRNGRAAVCSGEELSYSCIPYITPPYRTSPGYLNVAGACENLKKGIRNDEIDEEDCEYLKQARAHVKEGRCQ